MTQVWWHVPIIPALERLRKEDAGDFKACLGYC